MISILIPVLNQENALRRTLRSLVPEKANHQVLVVDLGSREDLGKLTKSHPWVTVVSHPGSLRSEALNKAAEGATGDILLFLEPGTIPARGWANTITEHFSKEVAAGHMVVADADPGQANTSLVRRMVERLGHRLMGEAPGLSGVAVCRDTFQQVEGFRPVPEFEWLGFADRVRKAGGVVKPIPHTVLRSQAPSAQYRDGWAELADELKGVWDFKKTGDLDPVRCRRQTTAAIVLGYDVADDLPEPSEYLKKALQEATGLMLDNLRAFPGVRDLHFLAGSGSLACVQGVEGVVVHPNYDQPVADRLQGLMKDLAASGMDAVLLVRGVMTDLTHEQLRGLTNLPPGQPVTVVPNPEETEWRLLWTEGPLVDKLGNWTLDLNLKDLRWFCTGRGYALKVQYPGISAMLTEQDALKGHYAGILQDASPA